jgi:hypothetical protein
MAGFGVVAGQSAPGAAPWWLGIVYEDEFDAGWYDDRYGIMDPASASGAEDDAVSLAWFSEGGTLWERVPDGALGAAFDLHYEGDFSGPKGEPFPEPEPWEPEVEEFPDLPEPMAEPSPWFGVPPYMYWPTPQPEHEDDLGTIFM